MHESNFHGMSGSPVFSMKRLNGEIRYWLHAVQESWNTFDYISACLMTPFAVVLKEIGESKYASAEPPSQNGT